MTEIHPARLMDFETMYAAIQEREAAGLVKRQTDGNLAIFNYAKRCQFDKAWDEITTITRGLVLDTVSRTVVATAFPKFFNLGERKEFSEPKDDMYAWEKVDGSMGLVFCHEGRWRVATRGSFTSPQAAAGQRILDACGYDLGKLDNGWTLLFEIVAPETRVVVPYEGERLVLLGAYSPSGVFKDPLSVVVGTDERFNMPLIYGEYTTLEDVRAAAEKLPATEEGFVCHWPRSGVRMKVKGAAYVAAHRAASHCRPLDVWSLLRDGTPETRHAAKAAMPPGLAADLDIMSAILMQKHEDWFCIADDWYRLNRGLDRKGYAQAMSYFKCKHMQRVAWALYDGKFDAAMKHVWDKIRPDNNVLPGYIPSLAMNNIDEATP